MQNNILLFLLFSLICVIIYHILPRYKGAFLLGINFLFYLMCDSNFLILLIISITWTHFIGKVIYHSTLFKRKLYLFIGILPCVLLLFVFKYFNFFYESFFNFFSVNQVTSDSNILQLLLPLGISYYLFKSISYLSDIYLHRMDAEHSYIRYAIYISFFPQMICGPIMRPNKFLSQLSGSLLFNKLLFQKGYTLIISGLFKKLVIADRISPYVTTIFSNPTLYPSISLWLATFLYTVQIYCDFAGYSEIVVGITNLFGFDCSPNFIRPYFSKNINEFWKRWHISLSSWLKDYIYIPLGGSHVSKLRKTINTLITFFVSAIWHGSGLNFLIWGLWHGILSLLPHKKTSHRVVSILQYICTFVLVMFGWVLFRSSSINYALLFFKKMFTDFSISMDTIIATVMPFTGDYSCISYFIVILLFIFSLFIFELQEHLNKKICTSFYSFKNAFYIVSIILFSAIGQNSFLYANF